MADCFACGNEARLDTLPLSERIAHDEHWRVVHVVDTALPGWICLVARRHVTTIAALTDVEAAGLGVWQVRISRALHEATGCVKTYSALFTEAVEHVHVHLVPRAADLPADLRGPRVFGLLATGRPDTATAERIGRVVTRLHQLLTVPDQQRRAPAGGY